MLKGLVARLQLPIGWNADKPLTLVSCYSAVIRRSKRTGYRPYRVVSCRTPRPMTNLSSSFDVMSPGSVVHQNHRRLETWKSVSPSVRITPPSGRAKAWQSCCLHMSRAKLMPSNHPRMTASNIMSDLFCVCIVVIVCVVRFICLGNVHVVRVSGI